MPNFRLSLNDNLPSTVPSAQEVVYQLTNGTTRKWFVEAYNPVPLANTSVPVVTTATDLVNFPNVSTRTLRMHYPSSPHTVDHQIRNVIRS